MVTLPATGIYPSNKVSAVCGASACDVYTEDDLFSASIPASLGTNVNSVNRVLAARAIGITYHDPLNPPSVGLSVSRNHDLNGCMWHTIETSPGVYDWAKMDAWVDHCYANQIDAVFVWASTPVFRSARPTESGMYGPGTAAEPVTLSDVADFMALVALRYIGRNTPIKYFEVGNEAKYSTGGASYFTGTPAVLAQCTRIINQSVKAVDPSAKILSMSPTGCEFTWVMGDNSGTDYLHKMLSASDGAGGFGKDWVDIIAFHSYGHNGFNNQFAIPLMVSNMRAVLSANGMSTSTPLWITEGGALSPVYSAQSIKDRNDFLSQSLLLAFGAGVERFIWYADNATLGGFSSNAELGVHWNTMRTLLEGAILGVVNYAPPITSGSWNNNGKMYGRVFAVIDNKRYVL